MILTGKALEDFENWYWNEWFSDKERSHYKNNIHEAIRALHTTDKVFLHALIIEWFDSVGIYLTIGIYGYMLNTEHINFTKKTGNSRQEATQEAIIKANEIYNSLT